MWLPVRILLFLIILFLSGLIFYGSLQFLEPDFSRGYLMGKEELFDSYLFPTGLYIHMIATPICLVLSAILVFFKLENRIPKTHRLIGKITLMGILFLVVPSGLILSTAAIGGFVGKSLFLFISLFTGFVFALAWKHAVNKKILHHKRWMIRGFLLLNGALFLRLSMFICSYYFQLNSVNSYLLCVVLSWFVPILIFQLIISIKSKPTPSHKFDAK